MATRLYIGNLPFKTTDADLKSWFDEAGSVTSAAVVADRMTGRSRGFGFVEMGGEDEAKKAIEMLNGKEFDGRKIVVNEARPRTGQ